MSLGRVRAALAGLLWFVPVFAVAAVSVEPRDPAGLLPPSYARLVAYDREAGAQERVFMRGRLERAARDFRGPGAVRSDATLESAVYRFPEGTRPVDLIRHYGDQIDVEPLFQCDGRDCGRSNEWANQLFGSPLLYGPDARQSYAAWLTEGKQISVYAIERGNRRVYATVRVLVPTGTDQAADQLRRQLINHGWVVIPDVVPAADGTLSPSSLAATQRFADVVRGLDFWVVCHLDAVDPVATLLRASAACASTVAENLSPDGAGPNVFGAGPLLPRTAALGNRVELVLPEAVRNSVPDASASSPDPAAP